jgi:CDP-diglyceride synthetase
LDEDNLKAMLIDILPIWVLFLGIVAAVVLSTEVGYRLGRRVCRNPAHEKEAPVSSIAGVILGLQAFMIGFTFSIVSDRYETKKALVREEANAIRTAYNRADFLQEPDRERSKKLFIEYLDQRIAVGLSRDQDSIPGALADAVRIQQQLWEMAVVNARIDLNSDIGALYVESVNQVAEFHSTRVSVGILARIPTGIWIVLLSVLILGTMVVGYHTAISHSRRSRSMPLLAISFAMVLSLVAALDHPGDLIVPIPQQALVNVRSELQP